MKTFDFIWLGILAAFILFIVSPWTHDSFIVLSTNHPYLMGFVKFSILASLGELLAIRIKRGSYLLAHQWWLRFIIWGLIGMLITLMFTVYSFGVKGAMSTGLLPGGDSKLVFAFLNSLLMNVLFAPTFMAFHRFTDTMIDFHGVHHRYPSIIETTPLIDWSHFISFVVLKTIPLFWIPAHTITFLLPNEYRILMAAFLSLFLGILLAFGSKKPE